MIEFVVGIAAATLTTISFIPQIIKIYKKKNAKDISIIMLLVFLAGVSLWLVYGILVHQAPIIIANAVTLFLIAVLITLWVKYH